jgi:glycosyltransferase involved in cell wall biosynthesis
MRVCIGAGGRFHILDLARQMERFGYLTRIYTGYPRSRVDGLPLERVSTHPFLTLVSHAVGRFGSRTVYDRANLAAIVDFDRWMATSLEPCDILHTLSSFGTETQKAAKSRHGAFLVCDRGSSHISFQDEILREESEIWKQPYHPIDPRIVERELEEYEAADRIVVPSGFAAQSFLDKGLPADKVREAALGVDLGLFHPAAKEDRVFRVLFVGSLSLRKGIPYLLEAMGGLRLPNLELWLIGGIAKETRPFLAKHEGRFRHLGILPRSKLFRYYSQGAVLVLPSIEDGFGLVLAQAMACGLPVIATTNTGATSLFTEGKEGFVVPIRDAEAIRDRILRLYRDPELQREMSTNALECVKHLGGWSRYGDRMKEIYQEGLDSLSGPSAPPLPSLRVSSPKPLPALRVSVSVGGKFHAFHLAEQLAKREWLQQFLTTYFNPKRNAWGLDIPKELVHTNFLPEIISRVPAYLIGPGRGHWDFRKGEYFDRWASSELRPCDVFIGWSGFSLHTQKKARKMGASLILVRGSAHIVTQKQLLDEEGTRFGITESEVDMRTVEKELQEYETTDLIAMPSRFCQRSFLEQGLPKEKLRIWPFGADIRRYGPSKEPPPEVSSNHPFRVLSVGEIGVRKGTYYLVEAFRKLNLPNSELLMVGAARPNILPYLKQQPDNIKTPGVIRYPALQKIYHSASVVVAPSIEDGFSQVVLQALASGIPVIVSENNGACEAITDGVNGLVVPARSTEALAAAIERVYREPRLRRAMGAGARDSALRYTWNQYGAVVESTMLEILDRRAAVASA